MYSGAVNRKAIAAQEGNNGNGARAPYPLCNGPTERPMAKRGAGDGGAAEKCRGGGLKFGLKYGIIHGCDCVYQRRTC